MANEISNLPESSAPFMVYVIRDKDGKLYKGMTSNLEQRLKQHEDGLSTWTKGRGPFELVYQEECSSKSEALKRELFLKSGKGRELLKEFLQKQEAEIKAYPPQADR